MKYIAISGFNVPLKFVFYGCWLAFGIIQATWTDLFHDEAFYWFCAQKLSWGYLEKPPMVNFLIYMGNLFIPGDLGTRIIFVLLNVFSIYLLEKILKPANFLLFAVIVSSVAILSIGGFMAMCDNALIFFTATFFLLYRRYLNEDSILLALLLGINAAAMLYSKHYGLLIIFFVLASNISLLKRKSFYLSIGLSMVLLVPAVFWQYDHGFVSLRYHLFDSLSQPFEITNMIDFIIGQILIAGPITGALFLFASIRHNAKGKFESGLKYTLVGMFGFFLLATFQFKVLPHWTSSAVIPMVLLAYTYLDSKKQLAKWVFYLFPINILLVVAIRLYFMVDILPPSWALNTDYHKWEVWAKEMDRVGDSKPLIFLDDDIVKYNYYSNNVAYVLSDISGRTTQYDLWDTEQDLQGKQVVLISKNKLSITTDSINSVLGRKYFYGTIENFKSYSNVKIASKDQELSARAGEAIAFPIRWIVESDIAQDFDENGTAPHVGVHIFSKGELLVSISSDLQINRAMNDGEWIDLNIQAPDEPGFYEIRLSVSDDMMPPTINSNIIELQVK